MLASVSVVVARGYGFWVFCFLDMKENEFIGVLLGDGRTWKTVFKTQEGCGTIVTEKFEAEQMNSLELQQGGWQAILNNFKKHVETI